MFVYDVIVPNLFQIIQFDSFSGHFNSSFLNIRNLEYMAIALGNMQFLIYGKKVSK